MPHSTPFPLVALPVASRLALRNDQPRPSAPLARWYLISTASLPSLQHVLAAKVWQLKDDVQVFRNAPMSRIRFLI
ncbi:hypothetical protein NL676_013062 [Syzygium grande]|nr:hypothetical protein NL676_013062 [Syzygium grande]